MTSKLSGTCAEELELEIGPPDISPTDPNFVLWDLFVTAQLPNCFPSLNQKVFSCLYALPDLEPLQKLLRGDSSARFVLDVLNFKLEIFEHTLNSGPRYGYIADCFVYSNNTTQISDWNTEIADQLLRERWDGAISMNFAFMVDYESLNSFHRDLATEIRKHSRVTE